MKDGEPLTTSQRTPLPSFTNLGALADDLARRGNVKLRAMMTQAWKVQSCLGDLSQAMDCAEVLRELIKRPKQEDTPALMATERALMASAIMLYARATSTNGRGGERGSVQLSENKLRAEEWADHNSILDVRNQAMAHVYSSRKLNDHNWHRDLFFAVHLGSRQWKPASASNQTSFHAATFARLDRMLPVARRELKEKFLERMEAVTRVINDDLGEGILERYIFDPVSVFGSEEGVRLVLAGVEPGEASFWVNEGDRRT